MLALSLSGLSCTRTQEFNVEKTSPNGAYRAKVEARVKTDRMSLTGEFNEWVKIQIFKGSEVIQSDEWDRKDAWESTFIDDNSGIEWVGDNVLRMGRPISEPFTDEIVISNNTDEFLKDLGVSCSKYEQFKIFDVAPRSHLILRATPVTPWLSSDGVLKYSLGYGGTSQSAKDFEGVVDQPQQIKPRDSGPLKFQIAINTKDLKSNFSGPVK